MLLAVLAILMLSRIVAAAEGNDPPDFNLRVGAAAVTLNATDSISRRRIL